MIEVPELGSIAEIMAYMNGMTAAVKAMRGSFDLGLEEDASIPKEAILTILDGCLDRQMEMIEKISTCIAEKMSNVQD